MNKRKLLRKGNKWINIKDKDGERVIENMIEKEKEGGGMKRYKWEKK